MRPPTILQRAKQYSAAKGFRSLAHEAITLITCWYPQFLYFKLFKSKRVFTIGTKKYHYLYRIYNTTWRTGRVVEVPFAYDYLRQYDGKNILEVGNVLSYYYSISHKVVDKYEQAPGVENIDIIDYASNVKYDLIIAISTLEHIGQDYGEGIDHTKIIKVFDHLRSLLAPNGRLVVTIPNGENPDLDQHIADGTIRFTEMHCMIRTSADFAWQETDYSKIEGIGFQRPKSFSHALILGIIQKRWGED